jgi:protein-tyrosine phosphatase
MLNSSSMLGLHGKKAQSTAENLLDTGLCHLMSSDTHGIDRRPFTLDKALQIAEKIRKGSNKIFSENAEAVLANGKIKSFEIKEKRNSIFEKIFSFII